MILSKSSFLKHCHKSQVLLKHCYKSQVLPKRDQNPKFTPLSETTSIPVWPRRAYLKRRSLKICEGTASRLLYLHI